MEPKSWDEIVLALEARDVETAVAAAARLHAEANLDDVPNLLGLLKDGCDFFVREAAAWPLAELAGPTVIRELFTAYQRGFDEGHDNDGFTVALLEIPALHPAEIKPTLERMASSEAVPMRELAKWLLEFCN